MKFGEIKIQNKIVKLTVPVYGNRCVTKTKLIKKTVQVQTEFAHKLLLFSVDFVF